MTFLAFWFFPHWSKKESKNSPLCTLHLAARRALRVYLSESDFEVFFLMLEFLYICLFVCTFVQECHGIRVEVCSLFLLCGDQPQFIRIGHKHPHLPSLLADTELPTNTPSTCQMLFDFKTLSNFPMVTCFRNGSIEL